MSRKQLTNIDSKHHICKRCFCSEEAPCYNRTYGYCWWVNREKDLCSHCFHKLPLTKPEEDEREID